MTESMILNVGIEVLTTGQVIVPSVTQLPLEASKNDITTNIVQIKDDKNI